MFIEFQQFRYAIIRFFQRWSRGQLLFLILIESTFHIVQRAFARLGCSPSIEAWSLPFTGENIVNEINRYCPTHCWHEFILDVSERWRIFQTISLPIRPHVSITVRYTFPPAGLAPAVHHRVSLTFTSVPSPSVRPVARARGRRHRRVAGRRSAPCSPDTRCSSAVPRCSLRRR